MKHLITLLFLFTICRANAQISGKLVDSAKQPVAFATVSLWRDNVNVSTVLSDDKGEFAIGDATPGSYFIIVSSIGFQNWVSPVFSDSKAFGTITLKAAGKQLAEVKVIAARQMVEQQPGGLTVNVQNSILTKGSTVLDVLARSPGVIVNPNDNSITLNGKSGVMVMLDGKLIRLSMAQLSTLLNSMSADDLDKIELLNTPPAKYDADGNAGLINIVTKKNKTPGTNGSLTASAGYGKGEKASASIQMNHNTGNLNLQGGYAFEHDRSYGLLLASGTEDVKVVGGQTAFDYNSHVKPLSNANNLNMAADLNLRNNNAIGVSIDYDFNDNESNSNNKGYYDLRPDSILYFNANLNGNNHSSDLLGSVYFKSNKLRLDADYIAYKSNGPTEVQSSFVDNHGNPAGVGDSLYANHQRDLSNTLIQVGVLKADYSTQLSTNWKLEAGAKGTYTKSAAVSGIENLVDGQWQLSSIGTSSSLTTREVIAAGYFTFSAQLDSLTNLTFGTRYEYSHNTPINRQLGEFFPNIVFIRKQFQFSYSNRISRPSYNDLASYITYNDPVSVFTGNPALKPTITHNFKFGYSIGGYLFSLMYSRDVNPILQTQLTTGPVQGLVYLKPENADWQNSLNLQATIPVKINNWWDMSYNLTAGPAQYKISFLPQPFEKTYFSYNANFSENFSLPDAYHIEVSGYYTSSAYYSNSKSYGRAIINAGIKKGNFRLSVSDIFSGAVYRSRLGTQVVDAFHSNVNVAYQAESRSFPIVKLSYVRSFGSKTKAQSNGENSSKEEQDRINK